jgi:excisionase family DNA binding protein
MTTMNATIGVRTTTAAERLGVDLRDVYALIEAGRLELVRPVTGGPCVTATSLDAYAAPHIS